MPGMPGYGVADALPAPVDREPLIEEFLAGLGENYAGMGREEVLASLKNAFQEALLKAHPIESDDDFASYMNIASGAEPYVPVWEPMQREAVMSLYRDGGMPAVLERFNSMQDEEGNPVNHGYAEDGDMGWVGVGDLAEHLLPPGARPVLEAQRQYEYLSRLLNSDRELQPADIAIGKYGGGNYMRTGDTNWFGGAASHVPRNHAGPMYYGAQDTPAMSSLTMNPHKPSVTGLFGVMDVFPKSLAYLGESKGPGEAGSRTIDRIRNLMSDDALTEMPTSREDGTSYWSQRRDTDAAKLALSESEPDEGQDLLQTVGLPDKYNSPALGLAATVGLGLLDPSPVWGTAPDIMFDAAEAAAKQGVKRSWSHIAKQAPKNISYDAGTDAATQAPFLAQPGLQGIDRTPSERHESTRQGEEFMKNRAPASQGGGMWGNWTQRGNHFREVLKEATEPMQRMAATNKHIRGEMHDEAMRRWKDERESQQQGGFGGW